MLNHNKNIMLYFSDLTFMQNFENLGHKLLLVGQPEDIHDFNKNTGQMSKGTLKQNGLILDETVTYILTVTNLISQ